MHLKHENEFYLSFVETVYMHMHMQSKIDLKYVWNNFPVKNREKMLTGFYSEMSMYSIYIILHDVMCLEYTTAKATCSFTLQLKTRS